MTKPQKLKGRIRRSKIQYAMVGFYDLLGFSDRVKKIKSEKALEKLAIAIESVHRHFDFASREHDTRDLHKDIKKHVLAFSDCLVTSLSLESDYVRGEGPFDTIGYEILGLAYAQYQSVLDGNFLRGGLDIGFWYNHKNILISPALVSSYNIERHIACYPVIAVSDTLYHQLRKSSGRKQYSKSYDPFPSMFQFFLHPESAKRIRFLNYIGMIIPDLGWQYDRKTYARYMAAPRDSDTREEIMARGYTKTLKKFFGQHRDVVAKALRNAKQENIRKKYEFLADYHNRELRKVFTKPDELLIVL